MSQGLHFDKWKIKKRGYDIVPEIIEDSKVEILKESIKEAQGNKGWTKSREAKHLGRIPNEVYYNYALANGVRS